MAKTVIRNILRLVFLVLLQALVVNRLQLLDGMMFPMVYLFGLLMLPFNTPKWMLMIVAFLVGLTMDGFSDTPGFHASAALLMTFVQPLVQKILAPREGYEFGQKPTIQSMGLVWYVLFAGILVLIHHLWYFYLEVFRFDNFFHTLGKAALSGIGTLVLLVLGQFLIYTQKPRSA
jgi:hypothetical protein